MQHSKLSHDLKVFVKVINHGSDAFVQERFPTSVCSGT